MLRLADEVSGAIRIKIAGDTKRMLFILKTGRGPTRRRVARAHRVSVAWLHAQLARGGVELFYVWLDGVVADVFTKSTHVPTKWIESRKLIAVFCSGDEWHQAVCRALPSRAAPAHAFFVAQLCTSKLVLAQSTGYRAGSTLP